ncbi:hypothetical protein BDZ97DRAFT_1835253 [Flammula alnicola]|nr:hypothetical protein BDZ97DRAFT_1835253 [Flammula alnicola]
MLFSFHLPVDYTNFSFMATFNVSRLAVRNEKIQRKEDWITSQIVCKLQGDVDDLEADCDQLDAQMRSLRSKLEAKSKGLAAKDKELREAKEELKIYRDRVSTLEKKIEQVGASYRKFPRGTFINLDKDNFAV